MLIRDKSNLTQNCLTEVFSWLRSNTLRWYWQNSIFRRWRWRPHRGLVNADPVIPFARCVQLDIGVGSCRSVVSTRRQWSPENTKAATGLLTTFAFSILNFDRSQSMIRVGSVLTMCATLSTLHCANLCRLDQWLWWRINQSCYTLLKLSIKQRPKCKIIVTNV